jgi:hypothetical protein
MSNKNSNQFFTDGYFMLVGFVRLRKIFDIKFVMFSAALCSGGHTH